MGKEWRPEGFEDGADAMLMATRRGEPTSSTAETLLMQSQRVRERSKELALDIARFLGDGKAEEKPDKITPILPALDQLAEDLHLAENNLKEATKSFCKLKARIEGNGGSLSLR